MHVFLIDCMTEDKANASATLRRPIPPYPGTKKKKRASVLSPHPNPGNEVPALCIQSGTCARDQPFLDRFEPGQPHQSIRPRALTFV